MYQGRMYAGNVEFQFPKQSHEANYSVPYFRHNTFLNIYINFKSHFFEAQSTAILTSSKDSRPFAYLLKTFVPINDLERETNKAISTIRIV